MRLVRALSAAIFMLALFAGSALAGIPVGQADLQTTKTDTPDPVAPGGLITYTITVRNAGPNDAANVELTDALAGNVTFVSLVAPAGWTTMTPPVGSTGFITATIATLTVAAGDQVFTLVAMAPNQIGSVDNAAGVISDTTDPVQGNESAVTTTAIAVPPTPAASLADASMPEPTPVSPLATIGFTVLLVGLLMTTAVFAARRVRG